MSGQRRRPMSRIGELIPDAARALGLEDELRLARAIATFEALVAERVPAAAGACRVIRVEGFAIDVEADAPIVAQELRPPGAWASPTCASMSVRRAAAYNPRTCQPSRGERQPNRPGTSRRPSILIERPAWPSDCN
jgi:hypothetical protein